MTAWTPAELGAIACADEIHLATRRADGTLRTALVVWIVRHDDSLDAAYRQKYGHYSTATERITAAAARDTLRHHDAVTNNMRGAGFSIELTEHAFSIGPQGPRPALTHRRGDAR